MLKYLSTALIIVSVACNHDQYGKQEPPSHISKPNPPVVNSNIFKHAAPFNVEVPQFHNDTIVVGTGSPESITRFEIQEALDKGGYITFNTGGKPAQVDIDQTLVAKKHGTVLDGGGLITLDGKKERRIICSVGAHNPKNPRYAQDGVIELNWVLKGIIFKNGKTTGKAYVQEPNPDINDGSGNGSEQSGGGAAVWSGLWNQLWVMNCEFYDNETLVLNSDDEIGGGAIYSRGGNNSSLIVADSYFEGNKGTVGGAINNLLTSLTVVRSIFNDNISSNSGGAIYVDGSSGNSAENSRATNALITLHACIFKKNTSYAQGGGAFIYPYDTPVEITECWFDENIARTGNGLGGGLRIGNGNFTIRRSSFTNNNAESQGGGVWIGEVNNSRKFMIENSTFYNNNSLNPERTNGLGGALAVHGNGSLQIINCTLVKNEAFHGGGIFGEGTTVHLLNSILSQNLSHNPWNINHNINHSLKYTTMGGNLQWLENPDIHPKDLLTGSGISFTEPGLAPEPKFNNGFSPSMELIHKNGAFGKGIITDLSPKNDQRREVREGRNDSGAFQMK